MLFFQSAENLAALPGGKRHPSLPPCARSRGRTPPWHTVCAGPCRPALPTMTAVPSGLPDVDRQWGGFAPGSAYLLVGRAGAGRSALALQAARAAVDDGARCLLISPRAPEALVEIGKGAGIDLAQAHGTGRLRLLRIPSAADLAARGAEGLAQSYRDLVGLVQADRPDRLVIEDFTPLVQFDTFERFHEAFADLVGALREAGVTLVIGLGDPANDASHRLLGVVETLVAGTVRLGADGEVALAVPAVETPSEAPPPAPEASHAEAPDAEVPGPEPGDAEAYAGNDGASTPTAEPVLTAPHAAPVAVGGPPPTEIVPPPPVADDLLYPTDDLFGADPADALMEQGFLADSGLVAAAPAAPVVAPRPLAVQREAAPAPVANAPAEAPAAEPAEATAAASPPAVPPSFAPLAPTEPPAAPPDPAAAFRQSLQAAFDARAEGVPFLVVAVRIDAGAPEGSPFAAVEAALRASLRDADHLLVDGGRGRAVALLPASGVDAGRALFAGLQEHLRAALGAGASAVLAAVGAVTVPDGQPFTSAADLLAYAFEG